jgi:hypothetical protein
MAWGRVVVIGVFGMLGACGARNGLDSGVLARDAGTPVDGGEPDAGSGRDASLDAPTDAPPDAPIEPDAGTLRCPEPGSGDFRVAALETPSLGFPPAGVVVAGDGTRVLLAVEESLPGLLRSHLYRVDPDDGEAHELGVVDGRIGAMDVTDGVGRVLAMDPVTLYRIDGDVVTSEGTTDFFHSSRFEHNRPAWNGTHLVVASPSGFFGALVPGETSATWRELAVAGVGVAVERGTSNTLLVESTNVVRLQIYDELGVAEGPSVELTTPELWVGPRIGRLDDGSDAVLALAGIVRRDDGAFEAIVQRHRRDGVLVGELVLPAGEAPGPIDLSSVAVPPYREGHGLVMGGEVSSFHGVAGDLVGAPIPMPIACRRPSIAAGPCGYVVACTSPDGLEMALAVPPG